MDPSTKVVTPIDIVHEYRDELQKHYPGFPDALEKANKEEIGTEDFTRQFLLSVKDTPEFLGDVNRLDPGLFKDLFDFMGGKSAEEIAKRGFKLPLGSVTKDHFDDMTQSFQVRSLSMFH